jgi:hypothetical protein
MYCQTIIVAMQAANIQSCYKTGFQFQAWQAGVCFVWHFQTIPFSNNPGGDLFD